MITHKTHIAVYIDLGVRIPNNLRVSIPSSGRAVDASNLILKVRHELEVVRAENQRLQMVQVRSEVETAQAGMVKLKVQQLGASGWHADFDGVLSRAADIGACKFALAAGGL